MEDDFLFPFREALRFASVAHGQQLDKGGELYICHCARVGSAILPDIDAAVVGVLHDVLEDTAIRVAEIELFLATLFPRIRPDACLLALCLLRRRKEEPYDAYIAELAKNPLARRVKLADLKDNLRPDRMQQAFQRTGTSLAPLAQRYRRALHLLTRAELGVNGWPEVVDAV